MATYNTGITKDSLAETALNKADQTAIKPSKAAELQEKGEQAAAIASGLTTFFSLLQQASSEQAAKKSESKPDDEFIKTFQGSLLGSLGASGSAGDSIEKQLKSLTSDESIEKLQAAFLLTLQKSLFTAKTEVGGNQSEGNTPEGEQALKDQTALQKLEKLSFGKDGLEINDGFDAVNILNHVPVVSELYKEVTEHDISGLSKLAGGFLYGGPTGLMFSAIELTSQSVFDTSISGMLANFDYGKLFNSEPSEQKSTQQSNTELPRQEDPSIYWNNSVVKDEKGEKNIGATAK